MSIVKKIFIILLACVLLTGCDLEYKKNIKIVAFGCEKGYSQYYEKGLKKAYEDVCEEYKDSNYNISFEFYDDKDDYELAAKLTSQIMNDTEVTAIIASSSAEICENQLYQSNEANKLIVCPHWIYDSTFEQNSYDKAFCLNSSCADIGMVMEIIADKSPAEKWAVCYSDDKISRAEIEGFKRKENIVDFTKVNELISNFGSITSKWKLLGVEGVVLIPYDNEGFDLLYRLKEAMPEIYVISDTSLDSEEEVRENPQYFDKVYVTDAFFVEDGETEKLVDDGTLDTWEIHGYNAFRMIADTAVLNDTNSPYAIAELLHNKGYDGDLESFEFNENGTLRTKKISYSEYTKGESKGYFVKMND